jgi:hypothetical protein
MNNLRAKTEWQPINFVAYLSFIKWQVLLAVIIELVFRYFAHRYWTTLDFQTEEIILWIWRLLILFWLGTKSLKSFGYSLPIAGIIGLSAGLFIGLITSLSRFADGFRIWRIFNIINETTLTIIVGCLFTLTVVYLMHFLKRK